MIPAAQILKGEVAPPEGSHQFMAAIRKYANQAEASDRKPEPTASASEPHERMLTSSEAQNAIQEKLKEEPGLNSAKVDVTLTAGTVKLSGSVPSTEDRDKVVRIAKSYAGNREIQDQLAIETEQNR
jgi:osmotically-inducible protein OsmY